MKKRIAIVIICVVTCICFIHCLDGYIHSEKPNFIISDEETLKKLMSEDNYIPTISDPDMIKAFTHLAAAMVQQAKEQKRISPKETIEENEKYYMRI